MSQTVAFAIIAIVFLVHIALGLGGWWLVRRVLSEDDDHEPPSGGNVV